MSSGHGEWEDPSSRTRVLVLWLSPSSLASDLYSWAVSRNHVGGVVTLYELHSGEDVKGESFEGADETIVRRAIKILEERGQCKLFKGDTSEEDGVKFF